MAEVVRLHTADRPADDRYLAAAGIAPASARIYRIALHTWAWLLAGGQPPAGRARRGATPPPVALAILDDSATPARLAKAFAGRILAADPDTANRELSVLRAAVGWWGRQGWLRSDPTIAGAAPGAARPDPRAHPRAARPVVRA